MCTLQRDDLPRTVYDISLRGEVNGSKEDSCEVALQEAPAYRSAPTLRVTFAGHVLASEFTFGQYR